MILADTSVWIEHLKHSDRGFQDLLDAREIATHPLVIEELACGNVAQWARTREFIFKLPIVLPASPQEILRFISVNSLHGSGLGAIDVHLLAAARLTQFPLLTHDKALRAAARHLGVMA